MKPDATKLRADLERASAPAIEFSDEPFGLVGRVEGESVVPALGAIKEHDFDMLIDLFAVDTGERVELTYHLRSVPRDEDLYLRTAVDHGGEVQSCWLAYPSALYPEREAAEMFGIRFAGHPNPKRLLTSDHVEQPLLLKRVPVRTHEEVRRDA